MLILVALIVLLVAILIGASLAMLHLRGTSPAIPVALVHGVFAFIGIALVIATFVQRELPGEAMMALVLFLVAALLGSMSFVMHVKEKPIPKPLILGHAGLALLAYVVLLFSWLGGGWSTQG